ncbi:MAG: hypothetical protein ACRD1V_19460 [Vicinamibacterales bacterium]
MLIRNGQNTIIRGNQITVAGRPGGVVALDSGSGNQVLDNVLDGGYHGHDLTGQGNDTPSGADDGIVLQSESGDTVQGNSIMNVFDAGVEGVDAVTGTSIAGNTITSAIFAGVSSYWCTHWQGNTVSGNTISQSVQAIRVIYSVGALCDPAPAPGLCTDNTIAGNVLRNPLGTGITAIVVSLGPIAPMVTNNVLRGNDLAAGGISLTPLSGFTDGGANVCGPSGNFGC